jgi:exonuclease I
MSLRRYLKSRNGLPDPKGVLSTSISPQAIARANREVESFLKSQRNTSRGPYRK